MSKPIDIAKILAMSKKEQRAWLLINVFKERMPGVTTADLAFRLRDEVCKNSKTAYKYYCALKDCFNHSAHEPLGLSLGFNLWVYKYIKPIDMILAALKAKEKTNERSD